MSNMHRPLLAVAAAGLLSACAASASPPSRDLAALDAVTGAISGLPITTASADARNHYSQGVREGDLGRNFDALDHFNAAVAADSTLAIAYLGVANSSNSLADFKANLARAEAHAAHASDAEQLRIQIARRGFDGDASGQLALAQQLVAKYPESPRAYLILGNLQAGLSQNNADARASIGKAATLAPRFYAAHIAMGTSYLFGEPRDFSQALQHFQAAEALAPNESNGHDFVGDAQRALNDLPAARAEYTRGHELNPRDAGLLQQRGHVNSFAGDYSAARADYDSALAISRGNERGFFAPFRAYVSVYAGDAPGAIAELNKLVGDADGLGMPDPVAVKANALNNVVLIGVHTRDFAAAEAAMKALTPLLMRQGDQAGSAGFRRGQEETVAYLEAWLAARKGDYAGANRTIARLTALVTQDANPRRMEPVHQLKGFVAAYQGNAREAAAHFAEGNLQDPYIKYNYAAALGASGQSAQAKPMFRDLAVYNFNSLGYALIRKDAQQKAS